MARCHATPHEVVRAAISVTCASVIMSGRMARSLAVWVIGDLDHSKQVDGAGLDGAAIVETARTASIDVGGVNVDAPGFDAAAWSRRSAA